MAIYINGNKIMDLRAMGLDPGKVYTKDEIDVKLEEYERKMQPISNEELDYVCIDGLRVYAITGSIGMTNLTGDTVYSGDGTTNIGFGRRNVTISENNILNYDVLSGEVNYTIYGKNKNTKVSAIINYD